MIVSGPKSKWQETLWPGAGDRAVNFAASRNVCGDFFEEATAQLLSGVRLVTNSQCDVCPDVRYHEGYAESKSVGNNGSAIIYTHRREKDLRFMDEHKCKLLYVIWHHTSRIKNVMWWRDDIQQALAKTVCSVVTIPAERLHAELIKLPPRVLNTKLKTDDGKRLGYGTNGYGMGWSLPLRKLYDMAGDVQTLCPGTLKPYNLPNVLPISMHMV